MQTFFEVSILVSKNVRMQGRADIIRIVSGKLENDAFKSAGCNVSIFMSDFVENGGIQIVFSAFTL